jgi:thiol-disulfide isomerase/thioredoxin
VAPRRCALALVLSLSACCALPGQPPSGEAFFLPAETLDGRPVDLSGPGPIRLIDVWATWCGPCREATPKVQAVLGRHPEVRGVLLSIDDDPALASAYV